MKSWGRRDREIENLHVWKKYWEGWNPFKNKICMYINFSLK